MRDLIRLENVTKRYKGTAKAAVNNLDMTVREGEVLVLIGPSGCGKSTTLRLVNRLIEPTSGQIFLNDEDVTHVDGSQLRRRIGYVIQQIGLFPHRTIAENIATVPNLLGWEKNTIDQRIDEMLNLVSMDPSIYRDRYPKQLSGGQAQRIGVARALAANPDVLLMDEPFGAIDPITRDKLQNEFIRLQRELKKTIVFVTHDIDEAIKMGDRIAILREGSEIAQIDTPEKVLSEPADTFVENFLGSGAILKSLTLKRISDIELSAVPTISRQMSRNEALNILEGSGEQYVVLVDEENHPIRWVSKSTLNVLDKSIEDAGSKVLIQLQPEDTLQDALGSMLQSSTGMSVVVDDTGKYIGCCKIEFLASIILQKV